MASAVDKHGAIARGDHRRNLVAPVTAVPETAVQQDHRESEPVARIPDPSTVVLHVALAVRGRQRRSALRFEYLQVVVVCLHEG